MSDAAIAPATSGSSSPPAIRAGKVASTAAGLGGAGRRRQGEWFCVAAAAGVTIRQKGDGGLNPVQRVGFRVAHPRQQVFEWRFARRDDLPPQAPDCSRTGRSLRTAAARVAGYETPVFVTISVHPSFL